jgi:hypothetical protein
LKARRYRLSIGKMSEGNDVEIGVTNGNRGNPKEKPY